MTPRKLRKALSFVQCARDRSPQGRDAARRLGSREPGAREIPRGRSPENATPKRICNMAPWIWASRVAFRAALLAEVEWL
jgi:hypothetical protein